MNGNVRICAPLVGLAMLILPVTGFGQSADYIPEGVAQIDVLPGWRTANGTHMAAIRIQLADGWKTYWRAPGEAGIPPSFDWAGSRNLGSVAFHWPVPDVFEQNGMRTIGYTRELVLPMTLTPRTAGGQISVKAKINLGVCRDVCMPMQAQVSAVLAGDGTKPDPIIVRTMKQRPDTAAEAGVGKVSCDVEPISDGLRVTARLAMPRLGPGEVAVIETADQTIWASEAMARRQGPILTATSDLVQSTGKPFLLSRSDIRITVLAAGRAVDVPGCTGS